MTDTATSTPRRRGRPRKVTITPTEVLASGLSSQSVQEELLTTCEAAALTKMSVRWFEDQRQNKKGPPFRRRGRTVRYLKSELMAWFTEIRATDFDGAR